MLLEKEILIWKDEIGLTSNLLDVRALPQSDFPKLIFQDFMNQLKLPKLKIGFELNTGKLIEVEPQNLEQVDSTVCFSLNSKHTHNLIDVISYYLLTQVLHAGFDVNNIYTNNHSKAELYFESQIPFSQNKEDKIPEFITILVKNSKPKEVNQIVERFFILMGKQYQDKLLLFLTYLDTKYKFKLDKMAFVESTLGESNFNRIKTRITQKLNIYA